MVSMSPGVSASCAGSMAAGLRLLNGWPSVVLDASHVDIGQMSAGPLDQQGQRLEKGAPDPGEGALDTRGHGWIRRTGDQAVAFQGTECHGQHARGDPFDGALQFAEAHGAVPKKRDDIERPLVADAVEDLPGPAGRRIGNRLGFDVDSHSYLWGSGDDSGKRLWFMWRLSPSASIT